MGDGAGHGAAGEPRQDGGVDRRRMARPDPRTVITERGRTALLRKYSEAEISDARGITRARLLSRFVNEMASKKFGAIAFGYEGVLHDTCGDHGMPLKEIGVELERLLRGGMIIGIVSGMGHEEIGPILRHAIPAEYHGSTHVGYCNGSKIATLDESPDSDCEPDSGLEKLLRAIRSPEVGIPDARIVLHPRQQVSIKNDAGTKYRAVKIAEMIRAKYSQSLSGVKILESEGRIDIIPQRVSRYSIVGSLKNAIPKDRHVLCIGSSGQWPGADAELLTHRYSLSTDTVSATAASCWNLLPAGERGEQGALSYMRGIRAHEDGVGFGVSM